MLQISHCLSLEPLGAAPSLRSLCPLPPGQRSAKAKPPHFRPGRGGQGAAGGRAGRVGVGRTGREVGGREPHSLLHNQNWTGYRTTPSWHGNLTEPRKPGQLVRIRSDIADFRPTFAPQPGRKCQAAERKSTHQCQSGRARLGWSMATRRAPHVWLWPGFPDDPCNTQKCQ